MKKGIVIHRPAPIEPVGRAFPIDQFPIQSFNLNECGFPRNDIDAFEMAQNDAVKQNILRRLEKIGHASFDKRPTKEILETVMPNGCQSPAEVSRYSSRLAAHYRDVLESRAVVKKAQADAAAAAAAAKKAQADAEFDKRFKESMIKFNESNSKK